MQSEFRETIYKYMDEHELALSSRANRIMNMVEANDGNCPCRPHHKVKCPCPSALEDVREKGRCHCGLFVSPPANED